jgi:hypothetical protein
MLYAPQQSHQVKQDTLDCKGRLGNFWEAAPGLDADHGGTAQPSLAFSQRRRLRLFQPPPQLIPATAGMMASSTRGGGGGFDAQDSQGSSGRGSGGSGGSRSNQPPSSGGSGLNRTGLPQGQERTVSYQPEERYWTDYLRIALPVVGLLLMLGLFWYWASAVIGNDDDQDRTPTAVSGQVITVTAPPPTPTTQVNLTPETVTVEPTEDTSGNQGNTSDEPTDTPENTDEETPEAAGKGFAKGEFVVTTSGDVNLRADKSTDAEILAVLDENTELSVTEPATEEGDGGYFWVGVRTADGTEGFVADEFLDSSE